jgi:hypothetical protein
MTIHSLLINYADPDAESNAPCKYWCRLAVDGGDEKLTVAAAAKMVDDLYNRNPCVPAEEQEPVPDAEVTDIEDAGDVLNVDLCAQLKSGDYTTKIRVIKSHPDVPHTSVIVGPGTIKSIVPTDATVTYTVDVETAESATLLYPVVAEDFEAVWTGISGPETKQHCEELTWEGVTTGRLTITHPTKYDLVTVEVPGVPKYEGSDRGDPQEFELLVFYNHQTYKEQFESPLDYDSISEVCGWYSSSVTIPEDPENPYPEPPPEPEDPCQETVMDRYNTSYKPGTQDFDNDKCCGVPPVMGSECMSMKVGTVPSKGMSPEAMAYWRAKSEYCYAGLCTPVSAVSFVAVGPAPGETCGDVIHETIVKDRDCCEFIEPITAHPDNPTIIQSPGAVNLCVMGGGPILKWETGCGLYFKDVYGNHVTTLYVTNPPPSPCCVRVFSPEVVCQGCAVQVSDDCTVISLQLEGDSSSPEIPGDNHVVAPGGYIYLYVIGGIPPYYWRSGTTDLVLLTDPTLPQATFQASDSFCGTASVFVMDSCARESPALIMSTLGVMILIPHEPCGQPPPPPPGFSWPYNDAESTEYTHNGYRVALGRMYRLLVVGCSTQDSLPCPPGTHFSPEFNDWLIYRCNILYPPGGSGGYSGEVVYPGCCVGTPPTDPDSKAYNVFCETVQFVQKWSCDE